MARAPNFPTVGEPTASEAALAIHRLMNTGGLDRVLVKSVAERPIHALRM